VSIEMVQSARVVCDKCGAKSGAFTHGSSEGADRDSYTRSRAQDEGFAAVEVESGRAHDLCSRCARVVRDQLGTARRT